MGSGSSKNIIKKSTDSKTDITKQPHQTSVKEMVVSRPASPFSDNQDEIKLTKPNINAADNLENENFINEANQLINEKKYQKSLEIYEKALKIDPENLEALYGQAVALRELGQLEKSQEICDIMLSIDQSATNAMICKGDIFLNKKQYNEALLQYDQVLIYDTQNFQALYGKAFSLSELGDYQSSLAIYERLYNQDSYKPDIIRNRANVQIMLDLEDFVIEQLQQVVQYRLDDEDLRLTLGLAYCKSGDFQKAVDCCNQVIQINSLNYLAYLHKGDALIKLNKFPEAIKCYEQALKQNQSCTDAYFGKGIALKESQNYTEAILFFDKALKCDSTYLPALHNKGDTFMKLGKYSEALKCYETYLTLNQDPDIYFLKAMAEKKLTQFEKCLQSLTMVITKDHQNLKAKLQKGIVLYEMDLINEAVAILKSLELLKYPDVRMHFYLGKCQEKQENYPDSLNSYTQAVLINPKFKEGRIALAKLNQKIFYYEDALTQYNILLEQFDPQNQDFMLQKAVILYFLDQLTDSNAILDQILKLNQNNCQCYYYKSLIQFRLQKYPQSLELIERALNKNSKYIEAFLHKIEVLKRLARTEEALKIYDILISLDKTCSDYYYRKSVILFRIFKLHEALDEINLALNLDKLNNIYIDHKGIYQSQLANILDAVQRQYQYANAVLYILAPFLGFGVLGQQFDEESLNKKYNETITVMEIRQGVRFAKIENFYQTMKGLLENLYGQHFSTTTDNIKQVLDKYYKKMNEINSQQFVQAIAYMIDDIQQLRKPAIDKRIKNQTLTTNTKLLQFLDETQKFYINMYNTPVGQLALEDAFKILGFIFEYNKEVLSDQRSMQQQVIEIFKNGEIDLILIASKKKRK